MLGFQDAVGLGGFGQREPVTDDRAQGSLGEQRGQVAGPLAVIADEDAVEGDVGVQQRVQVEFGGGDGGGLPAVTQRPDDVRQGPSAHQVGDGVDRAPGQLEGPPGDVLTGVVDAAGGAEGEHLPVHGLAADGDDLDARPGGQLEQEQPDAAAGPQD